MEAILQQVPEGLIKRAADILRGGGLVAFPTETVYGLGGLAFHTGAIHRIFAVKGRPSDNPLIVHIAHRDQLHLLSSTLPSSVDNLTHAFWPGPLTLVLKRAERVPAEVSAGLSTVAVRMPNHSVALALINGVGAPIAAPSANKSGRLSPTSAHHVREALGQEIEMILDGGPCTVGLESTVLDLTSEPPRILRPGTITTEAIESVIGRVAPYSRGHDAVGSPGLKHMHYAPKLMMILVDFDQWQAVLNHWLPFRKRLGIISLHKKDFSKSISYLRVMDNLTYYAQNLFFALHEAETAGVELLLVETVPKDGLGIAIMDRLERGASVI
jgi:L-threonylcarbamoyladenylate synthase